VSLDPNIVSQIQDRAQFLKLVQQRRVTIEDRWLTGLDCWKGIHRRQGFKGEWFNHFIPAARKQIEKSAVRTKQMLFPSPDFFEVYPIWEADHMLGAGAESWKVYLDWLLTRRIRMREVTLQMIRCYFLFQRAISKSSMRVLPDGIWPTVRAVDPFNFYVWPETATAIEDATIMFENTMMPYEEYAYYASLGVCEPINRFDLLTPQWSLPDTTRLSQMGLTNPTDGAASSAKPPQADTLGMVQLTECFYKQGPGYVQGWIVWNVQNAPRVTRAQIQPVSPYHMAVHRQLPGEHYNPGMMADLEPLNVILNDQFNMTLEGQATALFPPTAVDPNLVARAETLVFKPRAKWLMDPNGAKVLESSTNPRAGFEGIQMSMGMLESHGGMGGPLAEGQPARGMPRAGFAVSSLINLSMSDIRDVAETFEDALLTPILADMARLTMKLPPEQIMRIPGAQNIVQGPFRALNLQAGEYAFKWVGSLQKQDAQMRGQAFLSYMGLLAKLAPMMAQQGWAIDFGTLNKRGWREIIGERGADSLFVQQAPPQPIGANAPQPMPAGAPGQGGGSPAPVGTPEESQRQMSRGMAEGPSQA